MFVFYVPFSIRIVIAHIKAGILPSITFKIFIPPIVKTIINLYSTIVFLQSNKHTSDIYGRYSFYQIFIYKP